ncbi:M-phase phosphoprotein 10 [Capsaspora owczarzaki ATCC 30864]|uniref:M-phase phosphoprotein 10 n=1 Tax=Capsaspora owczarzaki (strain ATCC 30864) TaxID=595528 RepID=A0A0D2WV13_CAPO3|nr:M-phase phosphoprotein 10 [Capsaspora owczarzaki ATCC 30864]KJE95933.1 M-phase phosphoprotein 10 [Capsaspora owczarzaki ATCC 30864]|eukprot:XP_004345071.2 M-phase phosphoprotein 10 [Capsaspora owczarzaki ATCC 30864]
MAGGRRGRAKAASNAPDTRLAQTSAAAEHFPPAFVANQGGRGSKRALEDVETQAAWLADRPEVFLSSIVAAASAAANNAGAADPLSTANGSSSQAQLVTALRASIAGAAKNLFDYARAMETGAIGKPLHPSLKKIPINELVVDGFETEQIWEELQLRSGPVTAVLDRSVDTLLSNQATIPILRQQQEQERASQRALQEAPISSGKRAKNALGDALASGLEFADESDDDADMDLEDMDLDGGEDDDDENNYDDDEDDALSDEMDNLDMDGDDDDDDDSERDELPDSHEDDMSGRAPTKERQSSILSNNKSQKPSRSSKRGSAVDDDFFKLSEMTKFLEAAEDTSRSKRRASRHADDDMGENVEDADEDAEDGEDDDEDDEEIDLFVDPDELDEDDDDDDDAGDRAEDDDSDADNDDDDDDDDAHEGMTLSQAADAARRRARGLKPLPVNGGKGKGKKGAAAADDDDLDLEDSDLLQQLRARVKGSKTRTAKRSAAELTYADFFADPNASRKSRPGAEDGDDDDDDNEAEEEDQAEDDEDDEQNFGSDDDSSPRMRANKRQRDSDEEANDEDDEDGMDFEADDDIDRSAEALSRISPFEKKSMALQRQIAELESANVGSKPWQMGGEANAKARPVNSLLEEDVLFERTSRPAPEITQETTQTLEDLIRARIRDSAFDDVAPRRPLPDKDSSLANKSRQALNDEKSQVGLGELYAKEFQDQQAKAQAAANGPSAIDVLTGATDEKKIKQHEEIDALYAKLCQSLDALSNFHYTPKLAKEEVEIVSNVPAVSMEEIIPTTVATTTLLAPEELFASRSRGQEKGESELTDTDRKRGRRSKKNMQHHKRVDAEAKQQEAERAAVAQGKSATSAQSKDQVLEGVLRSAQQGNATVRVVGKAGAQADGKKQSKALKAATTVGKKDSALTSSTAFFSRLQDQVQGGATAGGKPKGGAAAPKATSFKL